LVGEDGGEKGGGKQGEGLPDGGGSGKARTKLKRGSLEQRRLADAIRGNQKKKSRCVPSVGSIGKRNRRAYTRGSVVEKGARRVRSLVSQKINKF